MINLALDPDLLVINPEIQIPGNCCSAEKWNKVGIQTPSTIVSTNIWADLTTTCLASVQIGSLSSFSSSPIILFFLFLYYKLMLNSDKLIGQSMIFIFSCKSATAFLTAGDETSGIMNATKEESSMTFPKPFYRWRPHPWHGLDLGPNPPAIIHAYIESPHLTW